MKIEQGHQFPPLPIQSGFESNASLRRLLLRLLSDSPHTETIFSNLHALGERCLTEHAKSASKLKGVEDEPRLIQYDAWGRRVDELRTGEGWRELKGAAAKEGIVAESYPTQCGQPAPRGYLGRETLGKHARIYAFAKTILFGPFSKLVLCPISMTDGAVRVLELAGTPEQRKMIPLLTHADPHKAWTAGQWMTERPGGSDISRTETVARPRVTRGDGKYQSGDKFILDGFKWFSSATDGDIALALARTDPDTSKGSRGLSLFLLRVRDEHTGALNGIRVHRLKKKLGTRYLPTAELELDGCEAQLVGQLGSGVKIISSVLNITRLYSASGGVIALSHGLAQASNFALTRQVGAHQLSDLPLHTETLFRLRVLNQGLTQLFFYNVALLGSSEAQTATEDELTLLRLYTPALKAFMAIRASEGTLALLDAFGGQGYMEDSGLGVAEALRDLAVERIWEGTVEVLSMDVVRVITQTRGSALEVLLRDLKHRTDRLEAAARELKVDDCLQQLQNHIRTFEEAAQDLPRALTQSSLDFRFAHPLLELIMCLNGGVLLLEQAAWAAKVASSERQTHHHTPITKLTAEEDALVARYWISDIGEGASSLARFSTLLRQRTHAGEVAQQVVERIVYGDAARAESSRARL